jgi:hypothetical protein
VPGQLRGRQRRNVIGRSHRDRITSHRPAHLAPLSDNSLASRPLRDRALVRRHSAVCEWSITRPRSRMRT